MSQDFNNVIWFFQYSLWQCFLIKWHIFWDFILKTWNILLSSNINRTSDMKTTSKKRSFFITLAILGNFITNFFCLFFIYCDFRWLHIVIIWTAVFHDKVKKWSCDIIYCTEVAKLDYFISQTHQTFLLKAHRQISKKRFFKKHRSWDKAYHTWKSRRWRQISKQRVRLYITKDVCL